MPRRDDKRNVLHRARLRKHRHWDVGAICRGASRQKDTKARGMSEDKVQQLVDANTSGRTFGLLGESRVNVLKLNLALDAAQ